MYLKYNFHSFKISLKLHHTFQMFKFTSFFVDFKQKRLIAREFWSTDFETTNDLFFAKDISK